jgi:hypothetical protein
VADGLLLGLRVFPMTEILIKQKRFKEALDL